MRKRDQVLHFVLKCPLCGREYEGRTFVGVRIAVTEHMGSDCAAFRRAAPAKPLQGDLFGGQS